MFDVKPIETQYKGYRFRSRLEARWAVFFDALGIEWQYEAEGYDLGDVGRYLPDFWLPTFSGGMFAEVKPTSEGFIKAAALSESTGFPVWACIGMPTVREFPIVTGFNHETDHRGCSECHYSDCLDNNLTLAVTWGIPNFDQAYGEDRMFWLPGYCDSHHIPKSWGQDRGYIFIEYAVNRAKSARFEFGEEG